MAMDGRRDQFFSGAGLAEDGDWDVAARDARDERADLAHRRRIADDAVERTGLRGPRAFFLFEHTAQALVFGARTEQRGDRIARFAAPARAAFDVQQLPLAAFDPIGLAFDIEAFGLMRTNGVPLAEAIARGETPRRVEVG